VEDGYARVIQLGAPTALAPSPPADDEAESDAETPSGGPPAMSGAPPGASRDGPPFGDLPPRSGLDAARSAQEIIAAVEEIGARRIVIDRPALPAAGTNEDAVPYVAELLRTTMRTTQCTTLLTGQRNHDAPGYTRLGIEEQIVDGIIDLAVAERDGRRYRTLSVRAMHGTAIDMDDRPFGIIKGRGIVFGEA
jgi:hypothetical protein